MGLYKDTYRCQKCSGTFTWCYPILDETNDKGRWDTEPIPSNYQRPINVMCISDQIYAVSVTCPKCGYLNEFNCKIEQTLSGFRHNPHQR